MYIFVCSRLFDHLLFTIWRFWRRSFYLHMHALQIVCTYIPM
jgi:hypothetical protein